MRAFQLFLLSSVLGMISFQDTFAQPAERKLSREEYVDTYKEEAIKQMHLYGIPASITLAQGILESSNGNSALAKYAKNHFGIKCNGWKGATYYQDDDAPDECFRKYKSVLQSYEDHSKFLAHRSRYAALFELKITDYRGWARGLKKAGYATNPRYADLLIQLVEDEQLYKYDKLKSMPESVLAVTKTPQADISLESRRIKIHSNNIKYILAEKGDTYKRIANEFDMAIWQIYRYNDVNHSDVLKVGDVVYLQPKKARCKTEYHVVKKGETMREISQKYGVRIKRLYAKNHMRPGTEPVVGQELSLKHRLPNPWIELGVGK